VKTRAFVSSPKGSSSVAVGETHGSGTEKILSALEVPDGATPSGSVLFMGMPSVGGGHQNRALAHGYPNSTPSGSAAAFAGYSYLTFVAVTSIS
jgi:hypothetical protein